MFKIKTFKEFLNEKTYRMEMTGRELHDYLEKLLGTFEDADLYHDTKKKYKVLIDDNLIKKQAKEGYISIDDWTGHEIFYWDYD